MKQNRQIFNKLGQNALSPLHFSKEALLSYFVKKEEEIKSSWFQFLQIPSISSEPVYKENVLQAAHFVQQFLKNLRFETEMWTGDGHPTIFASSKENPSFPTVLLYGHYDVQPVDPLDEWISPPFVPTQRDGEIYARGAQDNKGQLFYTLWAVKALIESGTDLLINLKFCIEGEEETGSALLSTLIQETDKQRKLKSDYLLITDTGIKSLTSPSLTLGMRGIATFDLELTGANQDLHSGSFGGVAPNPGQELASLLSSLHDKKGKVAVEGFYDSIIPLSEKEKKQYTLSFDEAFFKRTFETLPSGGEKGVRPEIRSFLEPTLEINGIKYGYGGDGFKTVIGKKATAKLSCRLAMGQDPDIIYEKIAAHFASQKLNPGISLHFVKRPGSGKALRIFAESKIVKVFQKAYEEVFSLPVQLSLEGATIPIAGALAEASGASPLLLGLGLPDDKIHAPNEHFSLKRFQMGFSATALGLQYLGRL